MLQTKNESNKLEVQNLTEVTVNVTSIYDWFLHTCLSCFAPRMNFCFLTVVSLTKSMFTWIYHKLYLLFAWQLLRRHSQADFTSIVTGWKTHCPAICITAGWALSQRRVRAKEIQPGQLWQTKSYQWFWIEAKDTERVKRQWRGEKESVWQCQ